MAPLVPSLLSHDSSTLSLSQGANSNSNMTSFMDLPLETRYRVYAYLRLFRWCPIEFNRPETRNLIYEPSSSLQGCRILSKTPNKCLYIARKSSSTNSTQSRSPETPDCQCPKLPLLRLLLVSRAFYHDVFNAFYSLNNFAIRIHDARGFESFHVGQHIQSTLTFLLVRLNCWPCPRGHEEIWDADALQCATCRYNTTNADPPMDMTSRAGDDLLHWWRWFAKGLGTSISSDHLDLTLICDVTDKKSGMAVVEPLLGFPTLKRCTIRLGRQFNNELSWLAEEASLRAQALFIENQGTFPFQRLPKELRLLILSYTHLGDHHSYSKDSRLLEIMNNTLVNRIKICCRKCTSTLIDCCCALSRAAYSRTCECRQTPFALLFVSKQMKAETIQVLLSQNAFNFFQDPQDTISFLRNFPQETLKYIRRTQFHFSEEEVREWKKRDYSEKFTQLVLFIRDNFEVSKLSITVIIESTDMGCYAEDDEDLRFVYNLYIDITRALRQLPALEDVEFNLGWFMYLEPIMRRAVLGRGVPMGLPKRKYSHRENDPPGSFQLPEWYKRGDFTRC